MTIIRIIAGWFFNILEFTILIECILSWIPGMRNSNICYFVSKINKPFLMPLRALLEKYMRGPVGIDFSPYLLFLIITFLRRLLMI